MRSLRILAALALFALVVFAQTDRATITGTVSDPTGALVANVPIELRNTETGSTYTAATSQETGNFTLPQLPIGTYQLTVTAAGFKKFVRQNITVGATQTVRVDAILEVGAASGVGHRQRGELSAQDRKCRRQSQRHE